MRKRIEITETTARVERVIKLGNLSREVSAHTQLRGNRGKCPFAAHSSHDPFGIFRTPTATWLWHCFACGETGNIISFRSKLGGISFLEALAGLESDLGLSDDAAAVSDWKTRLEASKRKERASASRLTTEILDLQLGLLRIEGQRAELGDFYHQLLSLDEREELAKLADQEVVLWARLEELLGAAPPTISQWRARCREIWLDSIS